MLVRRSLLLGFSMASAVFGLVLSREGWAQDVRHLCSEKYQAAKAAGTLNGEAWPQFYSKCTADAKASPPAAEAAPAAAAPLDIRHICSEKYQAAKAAGTLNGEAWPQFYSQCTAETKANPPAITATPAAPVVTSPVVAAPAPPAVETPAPPAAPVAEAPAPPPAVEAPAAPAVAPAPTNPLKTPASKQVAQTVVVRRPLPSFPPQFHRPMPTRSPTRRASKLVPINTKPTKQPTPMAA